MVLTSTTIDLPQWTQELLVSPIGFANAAKIPAGAKVVKILAIGLGEKAALPTAETIADGSYPVSRRIYLYVKPDAPAATKNLVKFILSNLAANTFAISGCRAMLSSGFLYHSIW